MGSIKGKGLVHEEVVGMTSVNLNLKHNLIEVYDLYETPSQSVTKHCNKTNEGPKATGMLSLILNSRQLFQQLLVDGYYMISILPALDCYYNACSSFNKKVTRKLIVSDTYYGTDGVDELVGKKLAFKFDITNYIITNNYKWFTINKLTEDTFIISKLEAKFDVDQVDLAQSFNNIFVASDPQVIVIFKGLLHEEELGKSSGHSDLKRKLIEVYDVQETLSEYSTKH